MEVFPGALDPLVTVVDLSSGAPRSTIALPHFLCQPAQSAIPAAICSGGVFAIISDTDMPLSAPSDWYKTRYLFMAAQPITVFQRLPERSMKLCQGIVQGRGGMRVSSPMGFAAASGV